MAMGVPVVATNVGGPAEIIRHGHDGLTLPPQRPDLWADALAELLADPSELAAMGRRARATAVERFGTGRSTADVQAVYARLLRAG
jgi:glycosyltransferase involved in cell wall biosynthesis